MHATIECLKMLPTQIIWIKKSPPTLNFFCIELTTALENEYGDAANRTWALLRMMIDHVVQPLLTVTKSKGRKTQEAIFFTHHEDIRLKSIRKISDWLQNYWCPHVKEFPVNKTENKDNDIDDIINSTNDNVNIPLNNECEESITFFGRKWKYGKRRINNWKTQVGSNSNQGRKRLYVGPSEETLFDLAHSLRCFSDLITNLLPKKRLSTCLMGDLKVTLSRSDLA